MSNNTLLGNTATYYGGGIHNYGGTTTMSNNTLLGNTAGYYGGGIYTYGSTNTVSNNILWANKKGAADNVQGADYHSEDTNGNTFKNNLLQLAASNYPVSATGNYAIGIAASGNVFAQDPLFVNAADPDGADDIHRTADDGLALQSSSPAVNTGITGVGIPTTDITGATRIGSPDMGAYEYFNPCPSGTTLHVNASVSGGTGDGTSWANAYASLSNALAMAHQCATITTIKVATGTYKPTKKPFNPSVAITTTDARDNTFHIPDGVTIEGGYDAATGLRTEAPFGGLAGL
jgi:parallel beta-helix repeat protein